MRAALQHVRKYVATNYVRDGVFGSELDVQREDALDPQHLTEEWDDVVVVMSVVEAEEILLVLEWLRRENSLAWRSCSHSVSQLVMQLRKLDHPAFKPHQGIRSDADIVAEHTRAVQCMTNPDVGL